MTTVRTIQPANTPTGDHDPSAPLPCSYDIDDKGRVLDQDHWDGVPVHLLGFQRDIDVQQIDLSAKEWIASRDPAPEGWYPVFIDADGAIWNHRHPVMRRGLGDQVAAESAGV